MPESRLRTCAMLALASLAFVPLAARRAAAQQAEPVGSISGVARRSLDSLPVAGASITLDSAGVTTLTDSAGTFTYRGVGAGAHTLHARKLGFEPAEAAATVVAGQTSSIVIRLDRAAQQLTTVRINGKKMEVLSRYAGIAQRVERNHGALFTDRDVSGLDRTRDVLISLAGVRVNDRSVTFARCQDSGTLPSMFGGTGGNVAKAQIYIDGLRVTTQGDIGRVLDGINPSSVAMIEVYTGIGRIPAEYVNDACAVVAIWTKAY